MRAKTGQTEHQTRNFVSKPKPTLILLFKFDTDDGDYVGRGVVE